MKRFALWLAVLGLPLTVFLLTRGRKPPPEPEAARHAATIPAARKSSSPPRDGKKPVRLQQGSVPKDPHYDVNQIWVKESYENNLVGDLLEPFDPAELTRRAANPRGDWDNDRRVDNLVLRAAAEGDPSFRYLLEEPRSADDPTLNLALEVYDYSVNGNDEALERILAVHAEDFRHGRAGDSAAIMVLAYVNEWDRVKEAFKTYPPSGDGAGGDAKYAFWLTRRYLYPNNPKFPKDRGRFPTE